jgi:long-chain acyl-CoA synthetase
VGERNADEPEHHARPWLDHYPPGIVWDDEMPTVPVHEQVLSMCDRQPDADALDFLGAKTTYGALGRAITSLAGALQRQLGVVKGTRVALLLPNTPFYIIAYYAVLYAGGTVVNCNPLYSVEELAHIVRGADARILVTIDLAQVFSKVEGLARATDLRNIVICRFADALPAIKSTLFRVARGHEIANVGASSLAGRVVHYNELLSLRLNPASVGINPASDVAVLQYTGGTTGLPRGALLSHANVTANAYQISRWAPGCFAPPEKIVAVLPFFHIFAMTVCMNAALCGGAEVIILPTFELRSFLDLMVRTRPTILPAVPSLLHALARTRATRSQFASLRVVVSGGAPLSSEARQSFSRLSGTAQLVEGYGLTEASPVVCCGPVGLEVRPMSIGQPLPATDIRIVHLETRRPVPVGERGELQVKGPQVMLGYNDSQETPSTLCEGWLNTGDVAVMDVRGYVSIVDRIKDIIITAGFKIYPRTIEDALIPHPAVDDVCVIGVADDYHGETPVAYVKLKEGAKATEAELRHFLSEKLSKLEMPREFIFKDALPITLVGKPSRKMLRDDYLNRISHTSMKHVGVSGDASA